MNESDMVDYVFRMGEKPPEDISVRARVNSNRALFTDVANSRKTAKESAAIIQAQLTHTPKSYQMMEVDVPGLHGSFNRIYDYSLVARNTRPEICDYITNFLKLDDEHKEVRVVYGHPLAVVRTGKLDMFPLVIVNTLQTSVGAPNDGMSLSVEYNEAYDLNTLHRVDNVLRGAKEDNRLNYSVGSYDSLTRLLAIEAQMMAEVKGECTSDMYLAWLDIKIKIENYLHISHTLRLEETVTATTMALEQGYIDSFNDLIHGVLMSYIIESSYVATLISIDVERHQFYEFAEFGQPIFGGQIKMKLRNESVIGSIYEGI